MFLKNSLPLISSLALFSATLLPTYLFADNQHRIDPSEKAEVDNTAINKRDNNKFSATADTQNFDKTDTKLIAEIRQALVKNDQLSVNAHNIKILAEKGKVTLRGPVENLSEKNLIEETATRFAGTGNVISGLEVKTSKNS